MAQVQVIIWVRDNPSHGVLPSERLQWWTWMLGLSVLHQGFPIASAGLIQTVDSLSGVVKSVGVVVETWRGEERDGVGMVGCQ